MEILVFHPEEKARNILAFCLESQFGATIKIANNYQDALESLEKTVSLNLVIFDTSAEGLALSQKLVTLKSLLPLILVSPKPKQASTSAPIQYPHLLDQLGIDEVPEKLISIIRTRFAGTEKQGDQNEFCQIKVELMAQVGPIASDVYIRLSEFKYVKLYKTGTVLSPEDFKKMISAKKVRSLYIKRSESLDFIVKFRDELLRMIASVNPEDEELTSQVSLAHEMVHELAHKIGFTPEVQSLTKETVKLTLKKIGTNPPLLKVLARSSLAKQNYISMHSVLLANIACAIATMIQMPSETTFHKLTLASLIHDFTLEDPSLAKISDLQSLNALKDTLGKAEYEKVLYHPLKAVEVIQSLKDIPGDVDFLIYQHHERPDGTGFPKGLFSHQIVGLSAVFIISHDLLNMFLEDQEHFTLSRFLEKYSAQYSGGAFKKIWRALDESVKNGTATKIAL